MSGFATTEFPVDIRFYRQCTLPEPMLRDETIVQVWCISQQSALANVQHLKSLLSGDEIRRACRFRFDKDRNQFTIARGLLRTVLGGYLRMDPRAPQFHYSENGKPALAEHFNPHNVQFNVAHSGDLILIGLARQSRVGVDVEQVRTVFATDEIAERFFSQRERQCLRSIPSEHRHEAFFRCWTRKEAYIKATGDGLSLPLDQFDVSFAIQEPARLLATRPEPAEAAHWSMYNLDIAPGYAGALVVERL